MYIYIYKHIYTYATYVINGLQPALSLPGEAEGKWKLVIKHQDGNLLLMFLIV